VNDASITYFPVSNGDMYHIRLNDDTDIIIDCNMTDDASDDSVADRYDVHGHLLRVLKKDGANPHVGAFVLSHADQDHCRQFSAVFYVGEPKDYTADDRKSGKIIIDELWFTPRLFSSVEEDLCEDAEAFQKEAKRRIRLYRSGRASRNEAGNRVRIIGYADSADLHGLSDIISVPGETVSVVNGKSHSGFSFFIHAPFKDDVDSADGERNAASLVLRASFGTQNTPEAAAVFFGGDAGCTVWEAIVKRSRNETLTWDIFTAPHHCSWSFFSALPYKENVSRRAIMTHLEG